jgi:hypothetical protein
LGERKLRKHFDSNSKQGQAADHRGTVHTLLGKLDGVSARGGGRWIAKCPAHANRRPSLSVRELSDERVLLHCFGGCAVDEILDAVGLNFSDLFPAFEIPGNAAKPARPPFDSRIALVCCADELAIGALICGDVARGNSPPTAEQRERLWKAAGRLAAAVDLSGAA